MASTVLFQELAEFLRAAAYSEELFHHTDYSLFIKNPKDCNGDVVYHGGLYTHNRVEKPHHYYSLVFDFTETKSIFNCEATKDGMTINAARTMTFDQFKEFTNSLFKMKHLYKPSEPIIKRRERPVKSAPSVQTLAEFMMNYSEQAYNRHKPVDWLLHVLHPRDNNGEVSYSGGLWTHHDLDKPFPKPYNSLAFSYSQTLGVYRIQRWKDKYPFGEIKGIAFEGFKELVSRVFA